jgi:pectate lyase
MTHRFIVSLCIAVLGCTSFVQAQSIPAFPGAEGFAASTPGGRGGDVYEVTNLNDAGPGSLRDAVRLGSRTVVFRVSGTIDLKSPLRITQPFITIAGQTAPGDGICVRYYTLLIQTHDVIVRFIRSRLGDLHGQEDDAISVLNDCRNIILDHCSATWSVDECLSTSGDDDNVTIQWCLIGESLCHSIHSKGNHGYGSLARANGSISWYHNLWTKNIARNPRLGDNYGRGPHPSFDVRYNVMYGFGATCSGLTQGIFNVNYVGNYIRPGPESTAKTPIHIGNEPTDSNITFFVHDNVLEGNQELTADNSKFIDLYEINGKKQAQTVAQPFSAPVTASYSAKQAYDAALLAVGAVLPRRDAVDARIIQEVRDHAGKITNSQNEVGGWPELKSTEAPLDTDHDGMPDEWEKKYGLNPNDPSDARGDLNGDGYTNLEKYLNGLDPTRKTDWRDPKNNRDPLTASILKATM